MCPAAAVHHIRYLLLRKLFDGFSAWPFCYLTGYICIAYHEGGIQPYCDNHSTHQQRECVILVIYLIVIEWEVAILYIERENSPIFCEFYQILDLDILRIRVLIFSSHCFITFSIKLFQISSRHILVCTTGMSRQFRDAFCKDVDARLKTKSWGDFHSRTGFHPTLPISYYNFWV